MSAKPEGKCARCGLTDAPEPHLCPYHEDVNGDTTTLCVCCEQCTIECADDI